MQSLHSRVGSAGPLLAAIVAVVVAGLTASAASTICCPDRKGDQQYSAQSYPAAPLVDKKAERPEGMPSDIFN
jgi:hypothetical protein